ncbi:MAG: RusA family crossover junction endodeoxyribonuclease [Chloroflexota bacterium]|nr:RusA family crossover junction endodeoxyribonuclease [Chloroflexota bacterium]
MPDKVHENSLIELLHEAERGVAPSPFGKMEFSIEGSPVSIQASKDVRDAYIASIRRHFARLQFLLTGEIILEITWLISAKSRFETDAKADIDNCLKPIIDALTGPEGLIVDDCQLRGLYVCWRHAESGPERLYFSFEFGADEYCARSSLAFVRLTKGLCTPVNRDWPLAVREAWAQALREGERRKDKMEQLGVLYPLVTGLLGTSRPFHVTRLRQFPVISLDEFVQGGPASAT